MISSKLKIKPKRVRIDDMTGKGWIAFAPSGEHEWVMAAPHGMFVVERK